MMMSDYFRCRTKRVALKRENIYKEPNILTLQLKRYFLVIVFVMLSFFYLKFASVEFYLLCCVKKREVSLCVIFSTRLLLALKDVRTLFYKEKIYIFRKLWKKRKVKKKWIIIWWKDVYLFTFDLSYKLNMPCIICIICMICIILEEHRTLVILFDVL